MHTIRLRGPWSLEPIARTVWQPGGATASETDDALPPTGRTTPGSDWSSVLGAEFFGAAWYTRRFHSPRGLTDERVDLVIEAVDAWADVQLNDRPLGRAEYGAVWRAEITPHLQNMNLLRVRVEKPAAAPAGLGRADAPGGLIGEVRLEIVPA